MRIKVHFLLLSLLLVSGIFSQETSLKKQYTLNTAIMTAREQNPIGKAADFDVEKASMNIRKAIIQKYIPILDFKFHTGLVPAAKGDIFSSPDKQTDLDGLGPFFRMDLELIQPLYTFGKATSAVNAAREGFHAEESRKDFLLEELSFRVVQAYWGLSSAQKIELLAVDSQESYQLLLSEIQKRVDNEESDVDDTDLLEAKSLHFDVERIKQDSIERMVLARTAFNTLLYLDQYEEVSTAIEPSPSFKPSENLLEELIMMAGKTRPDVQGLSAATKAIEAKMAIAKGQRFPNIFLFAGLNYAHADNRQDQTNPFAVDNFNYRSLGAGIGLRWNLNIFQHNADIQKSRAEYNATIERMKSLKNNIRLEVTKAFIEAQKNFNLLEAARKSLKSTKTWLRVSYDNWEMGIGESWRLIRAYEAYYRMRSLEIEREYAYNVSLAKLGNMLGDIDSYVGWVQNGRVTINEEN
ncbi:TolC family protein [Acidobacteriota bacterium]